jgi:hypothetical protein
MDNSNEKILKDASITGDGLTYFYWDDTVDTGEEVKGDIAKEEIDNVCIFPGNPNDQGIQTQPYILVSYRDLISDVKEEAKRNGLSETEVNMIGTDIDNQYTSGDRGRLNSMKTQSAM